MHKHLHKILPLLLLNGCGHQYLIPEWSPNLYEGNHEAKAIIRKQAGQTVSCADPAIDNYVCMLVDPDFLSIKSDIIDKCQDWKPGTNLVDPLKSGSIDNIKIIAKAIDRMPKAKKRQLLALLKK